MTERAQIDALCQAAGVALSYADSEGRTHSASEAGKRRVLDALGIRIDTAAAIDESLAHFDAQTKRAQARWYVIDADRPTSIRCGAEDTSLEWSLRTEAGELYEGRERGQISLPSLQAGYHQLTGTVGEHALDATILAAPTHCYLPPELSDGARGWGITAQVYSLRGANDVGIGTYADVAKLAAAIGERGGAFLGLSPVHALFGADPSKYSPYSPSSRLFLQVGLIAPHAVPGFEPDDMPHCLLEIADHLIDYHKVLPRQRAALEAIWMRTRATAVRAIEEFRRDGGARLEEHATFEALSDHFLAQGKQWSGEWPVAFHDPSSDAVADFLRDHPDEIAFHVWLQWIADTQLAEAAAIAREKGMSVGLYRDLAVGADRGGSEFWSAPDAFLDGLSVGAPPDPLGPQGQDWGLPPLNPLTLADTGFAAFRALVAANMRHAGAIRIDHAFQLQRLFVIPLGGPATDGVYLHYPLDALLAVLKIESHRARCLVIGEDLGTAPQGFSDAIMDAGMLSYRLLPFERGDGGVFKEPMAYPSRALAAVSTHDLPTFGGWWRGLDIDVRECLGVFDGSRSANERSGRASDRQRLADALNAEGLEATPRLQSAPDVAALRYLARTPCVLAATQLEDVLREQQQANLPGPDCGHPNWRRRSSIAVEDIARHPGLDRVAAAFAAEGRSADFKMLSMPRATYRLQLHAKFTFDGAAAVVPYLAALGITHVYVSPIQMSAPGSTHGYDVVDPTRLDPELGGEDAFRRFSDALRAHELRLLVDIVPNHLGVGGKSNPWWLDVLEWGRRSQHARFFDIDWERPGASGKLIVPFLGAPFEELLSQGHIGLGFEASQARFAVWYADHCHPVSALDYGPLLARAKDVTGEAARELRNLESDFCALPFNENDSEVLRARVETLRRRLMRACEVHPSLRPALERVGSTLTADECRDLCDRQAWRLVAWTEANERINYRRFFDITSLAGMRIEDEVVFDASHRVIFDLVDQGRIHGLRCDHVDGLADPAGYLRRLQARVGPGFPIYVEKILEPGEHLPAWPISGTTGYEVLHTLDAIFFAPEALPKLDEIARDIVPGARSNDDALFDIKAALATGTFASEFGALAADIEALVAPNVRAHLRPALQALLAAFPLYRTYGDAYGFSAADRHALAQAADRASAHLDPERRDAVASILDALEAPGAQRALRRFQQLTGPLMAKSFEDTLFYRDVRFIAANEVGCGPDHPGVDASEFHRANLERLRDWPGALVATATHDTKRGEDARGRLVAASHDPQAWADAWRSFQKAGDFRKVDGADAYFIYQAMLAACPIAPDEHERLAFVERTQAFVEKYLREGKLRSNWVTPDTDYELVAKDFVARCASPDGPIFSTLGAYIRRTAEDGARLGVARTVLKCTIPGVPDIYQGTELADLAYVDPDNRRPVDYAVRRKLLDQSIDANDVRVWLSGEAKFFALTRLLRDRRDHPATYRGGYAPIHTEDTGAVVGFVRGDSGGDLCVVARRSFGRAAEHSTTKITLPEGQWRNLLDGRTLNVREAVDAETILGLWPAAALRRIA